MHTNNWNLLPPHKIRKKSAKEQTTGTQALVALRINVYDIQSTQWSLHWICKFMYTIATNKGILSGLVCCNCATFPVINIQLKKWCTYAREFYALSHIWTLQTQTSVCDNFKISFSDTYRIRCLLKLRTGNWSFGWTYTSIQCIICKYMYIQCIVLKIPKNNLSKQLCISTSDSIYYLKSKL